MKLDIKKFNPCKEGLAYYKSKHSFAAAWKGCHRGDWMLWMAPRLGVDDRILIRAKALCANTVRDLIGDKRITGVIDASLRYADGEIDREELYDFGKLASYAYRQTVFRKSSENHAISAAINVFGNYILSYAVAIETADARYRGAPLKTSLDEKRENERQTASICREVLTDAVMEKVKQLTYNTILK
ncbi:MAG: hypothetical protein LBK22_00185 [Tannerella sp.]|jgi:hypothetical protein|nr:hypothetical protein [Tannerella sp.]